jgi:hypothetical protein
MRNNDPKFKILPNPAQEYIIITNHNKEYTVSIFDVTGKKLFSIKDYKPKDQIDIRSLAKGVYFIRLSDSKVKHTLKFIKNAN